MRPRSFLLIAAVLIAGCVKNSNLPAGGVAVTPTPTPTPIATTMRATLVTSKGTIVVELYRSDAPKTVDNFVKLAREGFYDGTRFHRVISDFMIQGGDPLSKDLAAKSRWGTGGPDYRFEDEINEHKLVRGSLAMANAGPNTNGSQFFIVTKAATDWLDGKHTNFGMVVEGMDVVAAIEKVATDANDRPTEDVVLRSVTVQE
ncbi:MAG: peptidyl-prolyl cis-trans isomerase B (cyclophilin B) [Parcubacteria group bacterium Gr01-1014_31]|nr:MAG: peptidyl-prolyl cis-trans isomerase B (cyclophilin B) [Parcubacteria group bacterium Gr01-1014_31]